MKMRNQPDPERVTVMEDELLSDILAAEREIRLQIDTLERQTAERLEALGLEFNQLLDNEAGILQAELEQALTSAEETALRKGNVLLAEARAFALWLKKLDAAELDGVVLRHLACIHPEGAHDRQDEQT